MRAPAQRRLRWCSLADGSLCAPACWPRPNPGVAQYIRLMVISWDADQENGRPEAASTRHLRKAALTVYVLLPAGIILMHLSGWRVTDDAAVGMAGMGTAGAPLMMSSTNKLEMSGGLLGLISVAIGLYFLGQPGKDEIVLPNGPVVWPVALVGLAALVVIAFARRHDLARDWPGVTFSFWTAPRLVTLLGMILGVLALTSVANIHQRARSLRWLVPTLCMVVPMTLLLSRSVPS